ncbi:MAG: AMP-dependent synthetase/ligase [Anaerovoracaceae bacterium]|jgi:long-chain acyl-CoA synthetase
MNKKKYKDVCYPVRTIRDIRDLIYSSAEFYGNKNAFLVKNNPKEEYQPITYTQMLNEVNGLGTSLLKRGFGGQKIAIIGENRYEWVLSYFAVCCGTGILVPIERELSAEDVKGLLLRSDATAVIYSDKTKDLVEHAVESLERPIQRIHMDLKDHEENVLSLPKLVEEGLSLVEAGDRDYLDTAIDAEKMSLLLFTSGTTGAAKGVMLSHKNLVSNVMAMSMYVNVEGCVGLSVLPMHHTYEMTCHILTALYQGCTVAICEGLKYIAKNMAEAKVNVMLGVPLIFESIYKRIWKQAEKSGKAKKMRRAISLSKRLRLYNTGLAKRMFREIHEAVGGHIKLLISGAAAMDPEIIEDFCAMGLPMIQGYGMTECSPIISVNRDRYSKAASVGTALPHTQIQIIEPDENGIGEIICKSDSVMLGYYGDPEETAKALKDGWLHTGDYGYLDEEGYLYITGRKKNVIVTKNGKNIFPEEVEFHLGRSDYILESLVYGVDEQCGGETMVYAQIVPDYQAIEEAFGPMTDQEIRKLIKEEVDRANDRMPLYKRVRRFEIRKTEFEKTASKKIKRYVEWHRTDC